ncbi:hypothetical protein JCM10212_000404 [Sporobolomyces blumeae]
MASLLTPLELHSSVFALVVTAHCTSSLVLVVLSQLWQSPLVQGWQWRSFVILKAFFTGALALGLGGVATTSIAVCGYFEARQPGNLARTRGLYTFSWALVVNLAMTVALGSIVWFWTLRERDEYFARWTDQSESTSALLQDMLQCCGYWDAAGSSTNATGPGPDCSMWAHLSGRLTRELTERRIRPHAGAAADSNLLNRIFTYVFGLAAIQILSFLTTRCLIIVRREHERARLVDGKRNASRQSTVYL